MLATVMGHDFTPSLRKAWIDILMAISDMMLAGAAKATVPAAS
jgi:hypothetical protein